MSVFDTLRPNDAGGISIGSIQLKPGSSLLGRALSGVSSFTISAGEQVFANIAPEAVELRNRLVGSTRAGVPTVSTPARGSLMPLPLAPQTVSVPGGSAGRSASPLVPSGSSGVIPGIIDFGMNILDRVTSSSTKSKGLVASGCPAGTVNVLGQCVNPPGGQLTGGGMFIGTGEVVSGRYGAGYAPMRDVLEVRRCGRGLVLGKDGICYEKNQLRKDERAWAPPRRPLLTGGELNAIRKAAAAARRVERTKRDLMRLGLMKRPKSRKQIELELRYAGKLRRG